MPPLTIPISKAKLLLAFLGSVVFVLLGFFLVFYVAHHQKSRDPHIVQAAGWLSILFFGVIGLLSLKRFFGNSNGLTIDEHGICDYSNASNIGLIRWADIYDIQTEQVMSTKFLLIFIDNPVDYIEKASKLKKQLMNSTMKTYGTPFSISSNGLKISFKELESTLQSYYKYYQTHERK